MMAAGKYIKQHQRTHTRGNASLAGMEGGGAVGEILELSRLNERVDYGCEVGAVTGRIFTGNHLGRGLQLLLLLLLLCSHCLHIKAL